MINKTIIGRLEYISLPELGFNDIEAKIDTGAYSSSIHCDTIVINEDNTVSFKLLDNSHPDYHERAIVLPIHTLKRVKSSNGQVQERVAIKTKMTMGKKSYSVVLSLTDRKEMKYPMLIGRTELNKRFLVDTSLQYQLQK